MLIECMIQVDQTGLLMILDNRRCIHVFIIGSNARLNKVRSLITKDNRRQSPTKTGSHIRATSFVISEHTLCADRVRLKHLYIETTVQKDFAQNSIFWKINFKPKIPYLRN